jgi:hypothetical protein
LKREIVNNHTPLARQDSDDQSNFSIKGGDGLGNF